MTTPEAAARYDREYAARMEGKGWEVFNPHEKPIAELPTIYGFNNGTSSMGMMAALVSADGVGLGGHCCSSELYMPGDLGVLEGTRPDRHETFREHYPKGYRMEFVGAADLDEHAGLQEAFKMHDKIQEKKGIESDAGIEVSGE